MGHRIRLRVTSTMLTAAVAASIAVLIAGCAAVGPDFQSPPVPGMAPPLAMSDSLGAADDEAHAGPAWWSVFGSSAVDATVRAAIRNNRDLAAATARVDEALAQVGRQLAEGGPEVDATGGIGRQKYGAQFLGPDDVPAFHYYSVGATASYVLDYVGGERRAVERERARLEMQAHRRDAAYLTVSGNVLLQAIALASAREQIGLAEAIVEKDTRMLELTQKAFDAGDATRMDILNAQRQLAIDRTQLPPLRQDAARAEHALAVLVGAVPSGWSAAAFRLEDFQLPHVEPSVPSELVRTRPDILAAEAELHAATASVGVATADLYPRIRLSATFGPQSTSLGDLFDEGSLASSLIGEVVGPVFDGGARRARRDAAEASMRATLAQYEQTVLQSFAQVADLLAALEHDDTLIDAQIAGGEASRAKQALARESHAAGNLGVIPVLDAERTGMLARMGYAQARGQRLQHAAQLLLALGGGMPREAAVAGRPVPLSLVDKNHSQ